MIIYGKNPVREALKNNNSVTSVVSFSENKEISDLCKAKKITFSLINKEKLIKQYGPSSQGIVAFVEDYQYIELADLLEKTEYNESSTLVMLDSLEDPHNLGAVLRCADATGVDGVIIGKNRSVSLNSTVAKVSTGAIEYVDVCQVVNLVRCLEELKNHGYWIVGLEADGAIDYREYNYSGKNCIVVGSEGKGISRLVKETCDVLVKIPMVGHVNSLNASVSASIIMYEALRNKK